MRRPTVPLLFGIAFICTGIGFAAHHALAGKVSSTDSDAKTASPADTSERRSDDLLETARLKGQVAVLAANLNALHRQVDQRPSAEPAPVSAREAHAPEPTPDEARAERQRLWKEHMAGVATDFQKEGTDHQWASKTTVAVQAALQAHAALREAARNVECRSLTCRIELIENGTSGVGSDLPLLAQAVALELPNLQADRTDDGHGGATTVLYLKRPDPLTSTGQPR